MGGGNNHHADLRNLQNKAFLLGLVRKFLYDLSLEALEGFVNFRLLGAVVVAFKDLRDPFLNGFDQLLHVFLEFFSPAGRNLEAPGLVGLLEIVNVAPVRRPGFGPGLFLDVGPRCIGQAGLGRACDENVVAPSFHAHAELNRIGGPQLTQDRLFRRL